MKKNILKAKKYTIKDVKKVKIKELEECECDKPEIKVKFPKGNCSLNQIIKCHGDQPIDEIFKHIQLEDE